MYRVFTIYQYIRNKGRTKYKSNNTLGGNQEKKKKGLTMCSQVSGMKI